ncbi:MAG: sensor histidine kinase [Anaerolineae bacterium]|nr:sensor histidine kinase [Anaerolineae bacterium]NUQ03733.1 sensor histidine kinase [Anaerolineae bacterium]
MTLEQALRLLARLKEAAPPSTAARLTEVIAFVGEMGTNSWNGAADANGALPPPESEIEFLSPRHILDHSAGQLTNILSMVEGQASSLRAGRLGRVTTEQADALKLVVEYAASGLSLIDLTQQLTSLRTGELSVDSIVFNPLDITAETWQRLSPRAEVRGHQFSILADDPLPYARGDYQRILAILCALVDNAIQYMPYGGEIRLTVNTLGSQLLFNVADTGIGLTPEDHQHVGEPFWRGVHHPLVRQHPGSGLHLYLAQQTLALMGGDLFFSGEAGIGSTFSFTLPAEAD